MGPIAVTDMHTGGEAVRIVTAGWPSVEGGTILAKRAFATARHDHLRRFLMWEPRGHHDMYGVLPVRPSLPDADLAVLFMHNEGWSTMCGHAVIALARWAADERLVDAPADGVARIGIECPCGLVTAETEMRGGQAGRAWFDSVPAFALHLDRRIRLPAYGDVSFDVAYGGAFYAVAEAAGFGLAFEQSPARDFVAAADALSKAVRAALPIEHPDDAALGFLYGSILTDGGTGAAGKPTRNVCVFADREVDRSPTGSGVTARLALMRAKGQIGLGEERAFESIVGSRFTGKVLRDAGAGGHAGPAPGIVARVGGEAFYCGRAEFRLEDGDALGRGFLVR